MKGLEPLFLINENFVLFDENLIFLLDGMKITRFLEEICLYCAKIFIFLNPLFILYHIDNILVPIHMILCTFCLCIPVKN